MKFRWERIGETASQLVNTYDEESYYGLVDRLRHGWAASTSDERASYEWPTEAEAKAWLLGLLGINRSKVVWDD